MRTRVVALAECLLVALAPAAAARSGSSSRGGGGHSYPASTGYSGAGRPQHSYPASSGGSGLGYTHDSAYGNNFKPGGPRGDVHHHYHYSPPQHVTYGAAQYPAYRAAPPPYVYQYRESGSRYATLLTGLALYNLAMMSSHHSHRPAAAAAGEQCKLGVKKETGEYEENRVDCRLLTSLMLDADAADNHVNTVTRTTVTNTVFDAELAPNTTLSSGTHANVTTVTVTEALAVKGPSINVTPGMQCYLIHNTYSSTRKKIVPCGLLQSYAVSSMRRNNARTLVPSIGLTAIVLGILNRLI